jgi:formylglycine-generating enzyme required for sulfatase activity
MKFALIPPGDFEMGVGGEGPATADPSILRCASPKRRVTITKPFYLGQTEVTIGQFRQFVQAASYRTTAELQGGSFVWKSKPRQRQLCPEFTWSSPGGEPNADDPVRHVSWNDAVAFCQWLARTEKVPCRLPTEAEWEYACRADSSVQFSFGVNERDLPRHAWFRDNSRGAPHPVGQKLSNAWQLFDMHGNVYEWCADWNTGPYSAASPVTDPVGEAQGVRRVIRGGAYDDAPARMYSTTRYGDTPAYRNEYTGFRVARTVEAMSAGK